MQVIGIDVWNGTESQIQNYAKGGGRNITYPLGLKGSSVATAWGFNGAAQSSFAIVEANGKIAFISSSAVPYSQRYSTYKQAIIGKLDELTTTSDVDHPVDTTPNAFELSQSAPNPFVNRTEITFTLKNSISEQPNLFIYDLLGREVRSFKQLPRAAGTMSVQWDGRDQSGQLVPAGVYFYMLQAGGRQKVKRLIFLGK